jgi:phosphatidylglycerophosphate synthase
VTEGERWTREQLELLLARRFSPPALVAFVVASQRRANAVRAARPALAAQERRWLAAGLAAYAPVVVAGRVEPASCARWWAATALMVDWHLGMLETAEGVPRPLGPADALTLGRVWLAPLAAADPRAGFAMAAFASDVLDGRVARATAPTRAGRDLEGLADAAFAAAALGGAVREDRIPRAAVGLELARLAAGTAYAFTVWLGTAQRPDPRVLRAGKGTTPVRAAALVAAGLGKRRLAGALLAGGSVWSLAAVAQALRR